jgi:hypothetical protein
MKEAGGVAAARDRAQRHHGWYIARAGENALRWSDLDGDSLKMEWRRRGFLPRGSQIYGRCCGSRRQGGIFFSAHHHREASLVVGSCQGVIKQRHRVPAMLDGGLECLEDQLNSTTTTSG